MDTNELIEVLQDALWVIDGLVEQQAMPDDWYEEPRARIQAFLDSVREEAGMTVLA